MRLGVSVSNIPGREPAPVPVESAYSFSAGPTQRKPELHLMTKAQLLALALECGLKEAKPSMKKADLIELLEGAVS